MSNNNLNRVNTDLFKKSSIGTDVDASDDKLKARFFYSKTAWVFITFFGTTRMPYRIDFTCIETGEVFESIKDPQLIEHYMRFRRR